jgi:methionyl aminopeptidase
MITIKTREEIEIMRRGGQVLKSVIDSLGEMIDVGVKGEDIEKKAEELIKASGGKSNFKGQDGFPSCICLSTNDEIVHGLSKGKVLKSGDIVTIDLGIFFPLEKFVKEIDKSKYPNLIKGFNTDMARTYLVGDVDLEIQRMVKVTKKTLKRGIRKVRAGITFGDLGETMQRYSEKQGFNVIRDLCGHGIGAELHEDPDVLNYGKRHAGEILEEGMVFCIEPMLSIGNYKIKKSENGFTYTTQDNSIAAHVEDMVAVTKDGVVVLTE